LLIRHGLRYARDSPPVETSPAPTQSLTRLSRLDRYDAFLHHIFKQTQGDAWFRPNEENLTGGVALRVADGEFRVFPYENITLEPFEAAVAALNPVVAVKIRSAAVHAALAEVYVTRARDRQTNEKLIRFRT
jgi:hypothetical protein